MAYHGVNNANARAKSLRFDALLVHTGQHYNTNTSDVFFEDLHLLMPPKHLGVDLGTHGEQNGKILVAFENIM